MLGPEYAIFVGMNILKFSWITTNLSKNLEKNLLRNMLFCKFTDTQPATLSKNKNPINDIFQAVCPYLRNRCLKVDLKGKSHNFETEWILCYSTYQQGTLYLEVTNGQFFTKQKRAV